MKTNKMSKVALTGVMMASMIPMGATAPIFANEPNFTSKASDKDSKQESIEQAKKELQEAKDALSAKRKEAEKATQEKMNAFDEMQNAEIAYGKAKDALDAQTVSANATQEKVQVSFNEMQNAEIHHAKAVEKLEEANATVVATENALKEANVVYTQAESKFYEAMAKLQAGVITEDEYNVADAEFAQAIATQKNAKDNVMKAKQAAMGANTNVELCEQGKVERQNAYQTALDEQKEILTKVEELNTTYQIAKKAKTDKTDSYKKMEATERDALNEIPVLEDKVEVAKVNLENAKKGKNVYVSYIDVDTKQPIENGVETINIEYEGTMFHTSMLQKLPKGYELAESGDLWIGEGDTINVHVRKETRKVYVSYIDVDTNMPIENGIETIAVDKTLNYFNTNVLNAIPDGYELVETGDVQFGDGDSVNVAVRKIGEQPETPEQKPEVPEVTEKTVYVSYIDVDTKQPIENGVETLTLETDATYFNVSSLTKVPTGYELAETGDIYIGENDTVNVTVRKIKEQKPETPEATEKKVYVSYIDAETNMPIENGIETITLEGDATYFNTSLLKSVPKGYELEAVGDVYIGENDTVNVMVRKIEEQKPETPEEKPEVPMTPLEPSTPIEKPENPDTEQKPEDGEKSNSEKENTVKTAVGSGIGAAMTGLTASLAGVASLLNRRKRD